jgi:hypothetical protein
MLALLLGIFRLIWLFGKGQHAVVLENVALRQQIAVLQTEAKASLISPTGPLVLDCAVRRLEGLAASLAHRSS